MSAEFPTDLATFTNPALTETLANMCGGLGHKDAIIQLYEEIAAMQTKIGVNASAVATSHDYKLSGVTGTDKAVSKTGTETLTNKTLTSPTENSPTINTPTINTPTIIDGFVGARATLAADLGTTVSGAWTKVLLDTETYDVGANFASNKFTASVNGYYLICGRIIYGALSGNSKAFFSGIYKNGTLASYNQTQGIVQLDVGVETTDVLYLAATNYVELWYYHTDATSVDLSGGTTKTFLSVSLLRQVT